MKKYTIDKETVLETNSSLKQKTSLPTYVSPILNQINTWARSTRPETVGALATEIFPDFICQENMPSIQKWESYYKTNYSNEYNNAKYKLKEKFANVKNALNSVTEADIDSWIDNLLFCDTFLGLYVQDAILNDYAKLQSTSVKAPSPQEEGQGIDGYILNNAYSVKPISYKDSPRSKIEKIKAIMIYYEIVNNQINYWVED